jgi:hypothetical protein
MVSQTPVNSQSVNSLAFQQLLANCGKLLENSQSRAPPTTGEILDAAVALYEAGIEDPVCQPAAFGMAVAIISTNLEISLRSAALVLSTLLDLRGK